MWCISQFKEGHLVAGEKGRVSDVWSRLSVEELFFVSMQIIASSKHMK